MKMTGWAGLVAVAALWAAPASAEVRGLSVTLQELDAYCPTQWSAVERGVDLDLAKADARVPGHHEEFRALMVDFGPGLMAPYKSGLAQGGGKLITPADETNALAQVGENFDELIAVEVAEDRAGKVRAPNMMRALKVYAQCVFTTYFEQSRAASARLEPRPAPPAPPPASAPSSLAQQASAPAPMTPPRPAPSSPAPPPSAAGQALALLSGFGQTAPAAAPAAPAAPPPHDCVTLEPRKNSNGFWNAVNACAVTVIGQYCFEEGGTTGCRAATLPAFGPVKAGETAMIYGPDSKALVPGQTSTWRVSYCAYDAYLKGRCKPEPLR